MRFLSIFAFIAAVLFAQAPKQTDPVLEALLAVDAKGSQVMDHLDELVNGIGPRLTSSDNLTKACLWARDKFKSFGIENARIEEWGTFPVGFNRGPWSGELITPTREALVFTTPSWTPGTKGRQRGRILAAPASADELAQRAEEFRGAWLLGSPRGISRQDRERLLPAAGVLGIITRATAMGKEKDDLVLTGGDSKVDYDKLPKIVTIVLQGKQYDAIKRTLGEGQACEAWFDVRNQFVRGPVPLYNVLAEVRGTEFPDDLVIVGGHIDSWDGATGTTDNGTGTATTLEAARLVMASGLKPRRTIRFMLWSGEEQGLLGSRAYIQKHPEENDRISAVLVHDGGTNYVSGIAATEAMLPDFERLFAPLTTLNPALPFKVQKVKTLPYPIGSDHDSYLGVGVPGFFWNQAGRADYNHTHHTQYDTYEAAIPEYQRHTSLVAAYGAVAIASLDTKVPRDGMRSSTGVSRAPSRRLGLDFESAENLVVTEVAEGSLGEKSGFKLKDKILKVDGNAIADRSQFREALMAAASQSKITVLRDSAETTLTITFDSPREPKPEEKKDPAPASGGR